MDDPNSYDWLPTGWTVVVKVRENGQKDKFYYPPGSTLRFNSKVGVLRFLDKVQNKASTQGISHNVVGKKGYVNGLPPGWTKVTKIAKKGYRLTHYIDPESGYAFLSKKEAQLYVQSKESIKKSLEPKEKFSSEGVTAQPSSTSGEYMATLVSDNDGAIEKKLQQNSETKQGTEKSLARNRQQNYKRKKEINLPCRASKRLAGNKTNPGPELVAGNQARPLKFKRQENFTILDDVKRDDKENENAGASSEKSLEIPWTDTRYEFRIPSPEDSDQNPKNCPLQQLSSSNIGH